MNKEAAAPPPGGVPGSRGPDPARERRQQIADIINGESRAAWKSLADEDLLQLRFLDLRLRIKGSLVASCIKQLYRELAARSVRFRPFFWVSSEFFSPDGVPGVGVPFYLVHPRLEALEKSQMAEVEGGTYAWCMRILRHETGHALDAAYRLRRRKRWRELFGRSSVDYPDHYTPVTNSREFVLHLDWWYAQSHPVEDFAETFAVWLSGNGWRRRYRDWPCIRKLDYVDRLMREIGGMRQPIRCREPVDPLRSLRMTLGKHYGHRREHYFQDFSGIYDGPLRKIFAARRPGQANRPAHQVIRYLKADIIRLVAEWTGQHPYAVNMIMKGMITRARALNLVLTRSPEEARRDLLFMATSEMMAYLRAVRNSIAL